MNAFGEGFRGAYENAGAGKNGKSPCRVFWNQNDDNKTHFRRNEFLFDVTVCSVLEMESLRRKSRLEFVDRCHWQVESELNRSDSRELVIDMSKLVLGSAENKLFVAAHRTRKQEELLAMCAAIASRCGGNVYLAFVAHPDEWTKNGEDGQIPPKGPEVYEWIAGDWVELGA